MLSAYHPIASGERKSPIGSFVPTDIGLLSNSVRPAQNSDAWSRGRTRESNTLMASASGFSMANKTLRSCSEDTAAAGYALIFSSNAARALVICFT
jgi:hypothetical protein